MIQANETDEVLIKMLNESDFDFNKPDPKLAWENFKEFFNIKVDCADDALFFQCGVYNFTGEDLFHFEFVRQFVFEIDGEYDHMEQLRLTIYYKPSKELQDLTINSWSCDCNTIEEFFSKVENMSSFKIPIEKYVPFLCDVEQEEV